MQQDLAMSDIAVLGVDACRGGWLGIRLDDDVQAFFAADIADLVDQADAEGSVEVVAIDMPIGLPVRSPRQSDVLARDFVGPRRASVFMTPPRAVLQASNHAKAVEICRELTVAGVTQQAFSLRRRIFEVEDWVRESGRSVVEAHPEVSFRLLADEPVTTTKHSWAGVQARQRLLAAAGVRLPQELGNAGSRAGVDDVLDAAVAAWTARRVVRGEARSFPDPPESFDDGTTSAIRA